MTLRTAYLLAAATVAAGAAALSGDRIFRILGGLPLGLMLPGLALSALLFRRPERLVGIERIMLVPALSLGTIILGGLLAWVARAPLHRPTWVAVTAGVTLAGLAAVAVREHRTPAVPAERTGSGPSGVRAERSRLPTATDSTLILPVFLDRAGLFEPEPMDRRRRLLRHGLPAGLAALMLIAAATLSLVTSIRSHDVQVTTLSVVPPGPADPSGERDLQVNATGLAGGTDAYTLEVTSTTRNTRTAITADDDGLWTSTLRLPGDERLTLALYQAGSSVPMRTVIVASAADG